jgi:two-component system CheB/CheR fusion protein
MARLLDDLLDVSRVTQRKIVIQKQIVDLTKLVHDAVEAVRPEMDRCRHHLQLNVPDNPLLVEGDPSRLLQIKENLLCNAAKYTSPGGRISLTLQQDGGDAAISVADNGQGIPPEMLNTIFELFVQGQKSLARTEGGMGIGLSLVKMLVELHDGTISVHSDGKNKGSTFTVRLPITQKPLQIEPRTSLSADGKTRVLIVEDSDDSRTTLVQLLKLHGYEVAAAADGMTGYELIRQNSPDVVLLDIGLPGMDGYAVARKVRSELSERAIRLVALTGYGRPDDRAAIMSAGFDEHLVKPVDPAALAPVLKKPR